MPTDTGAEFRQWLGEHVREMLALPGFVGARLMVVEEGSDPDRVVFCTHYELVDRDALDHYLQTYAGRMRSEGVRRFGDRFSATRRVLPLLDY